jgi:hypothetical protein
MDVNVCLSGADGRVVEGRATLFRHHREVSRVQIPGRMGLPWMLCCIHIVLSRKGERRREGGRGWSGKVLRSPAAHKEKKRGKNKPTARYLIVVVIVVVKGERLLQKKKKKKTDFFLGFSVVNQVFFVYRLLKTTWVQTDRRLGILC